jgi:hypothetical protein
MQLEAEELVKRVAAEPDNASRIKKMYRIVLNREPTAEELKIAIAYIHSEPMKEYEEAKNRPAPGGRGEGRGRGGVDGAGANGDSPQPGKTEDQTPDPKGVLEGEGNAA